MTQSRVFGLGGAFLLIALFVARFALRSGSVDGARDERRGPRVKHYRGIFSQDAGPDAVPLQHGPVPTDIPTADVLFPGFFRCPVKVDPRSISLPASGRGDLPSLSQYLEDVAVLKEAYPPESIKTHGVVLEMGALDGLRFSNSWLFEELLDWRAILIDANPVLATALRSQRPRAATFSAAICNDTAGISILPNGPMSISLDQSTEHATRKYADLVTDAAVRTPCVSFRSIFRLLAVDAIDVFFLDVEGAEIAVLEQYTWDVRVGVWVVETDPSRSTHAAILAIFAKHGYKEADWTTLKHCTAGEDCALSTVFVPDAPAYKAPVTTMSRSHVCVEM